MIQVRCRADGVTLRASVTKNETRTCRHHPENVSRSAYSYGSFWLYLLFRTVGEMAVIGAVILLYTVTFNYDIRRSCSEAPVQRCRSQTIWWISGLVALVLLAPVAGFINDTIGFGIGFLLGSLLFGLASLMIAISPTPTTPATPAPILSFASGQQQQQERQQSKLLDTQQVVPQPTLRQCLSVKGALLVLNYPVAVAILITVLFFGMASGVVSTALHW